jgi:nucleoside-diphosphate-sugar epimerase
VYWHSPDNHRWLRASEQLLSEFRAAGGVRAVVAGTSAEYDWSRVGVCDERASPLADESGAAISPYAECKLALHRSLERRAVDGGLSSAWGRVFFQYGPGEHPDRLVASVITRLLHERPAPCTHGRQIRSFLHVADVGSAFAALLDSATIGPVNIGGEQSICIAEVLAEVGRQIGRPDLLQLGARSAPASEPALLVPAVTRLRDEVGWQPRFTLRDGIADSIAWWRQRL